MSRFASLEPDWTGLDGPIEKDQDLLAQQLLASIEVRDDRYVVVIHEREVDWRILPMSGHGSGVLEAVAIEQWVLVLGVDNQHRYGKPRSMGDGRARRVEGFVHPKVSLYAARVGIGRKRIGSQTRRDEHGGTDIGPHRRESGIAEAGCDMRTAR